MRDLPPTCRCCRNKMKAIGVTLDDKKLIYHCAGCKEITFMSKKIILCLLREKERPKTGGGS